MTLSRAEIVSLLPPKERYKITKGIPAEVLDRCWEFWGRPEQLEPKGDWSIWLVLAGRGFGKSRTGAEWVRRQATRAGEIGALVGRTAADVRDVMVQGPAGILSVSDAKERPRYEPSKRRVVWPNGTVAMCYSADEADQLRGPQHNWVWGDEFAAWYKADDIWSNILFGLRLGARPRAILTSTPRPIPTLKTLLKDPTVYVTRGSTYENSGNLPQSFIEQIVKRYEGTRLGRQELYAEVLDDVPGALWSIGLIDRSRTSVPPVSFRRVVVAVDPSASQGPDSDETGIVVAGLGEDGHAYIIKDESLRGSPIEWARVVNRTYHEYKADLVVAEGNNGGEMVRLTLQSVNNNLPVRIVHARRGKFIRAEPVAALYEQDKVHHIGLHPKLEDQLTSTDFSKIIQSPDRLDALVYAVTELLLSGDGEPKIRQL